MAKIIQVNSRMLQLAKFPQSVEHDLHYDRRTKQVQPKYYSLSSNLEFSFDRIQQPSCYARTMALFLNVYSQRCKGFLKRVTTAQSENLAVCPLIRNAVRNFVSNVE